MLKRDSRLRRSDRALQARASLAIEYDLEVTRRDTTSEVVTLVAKARSRGADAATFRLLQTLRGRGFDEASPDGIAVPEPLAVIPELGLWLQRKVRGTAATTALAGPMGWRGAAWPTPTQAPPRRRGGPAPTHDGRRAAHSPSVPGLSGGTPARVGRALEEVT
jgi:hypothetical protein